MAGSAVVVIDTGKDNRLSIAPNVNVDPKRQFSVVIRGNNNKLIIHAGVNLQSSVIQMIGDNCTLEIGANCVLQRCHLILDQESSIRIGDGTTWASGVFRAEHQSSINIGRDCMLSAEIQIRTTDGGNGIFDLASQTTINPAANVEIADHVWLGHTSKVSKGTHIGRCTVLGMFSLATGQLDANSVYAGCPAKKVKEGITWSRELAFDAIPEPYQS